MTLGYSTSHASFRSKHSRNFSFDPGGNVEYGTSISPSSTRLLQSPRPAGFPCSCCAGTVLPQFRRPPAAFAPPCHPKFPRSASAPALARSCHPHFPGSPRPADSARSFRGVFPLSPGSSLPAPPPLFPRSPVPGPQRLWSGSPDWTYDRPTRILDGAFSADWDGWVGWGIGVRMVGASALVAFRASETEYYFSQYYLADYNASLIKQDTGTLDLVPNSVKVHIQGATVRVMFAVVLPEGQTPGLYIIMAKGQGGNGDTGALEPHSPFNTARTYLRLAAPSTPPAPTCALQVRAEGQGFGCGDQGCDGQGGNGDTGALEPHSPFNTARTYLRLAGESSEQGPRDVRSGGITGADTRAVCDLIMGKGEGGDAATGVGGGGGCGSTGGALGCGATGGADARAWLQAAHGLVNLVAWGGASFSPSACYSPATSPYPLPCLLTPAFSPPCPALAPSQVPDPPSGCKQRMAWSTSSPGPCSSPSACYSPGRLINSLSFIPVSSPTYRCRTPPVAASSTRLGQPARLGSHPPMLLARQTHQFPFLHSRIFPYLQVPDPPSGCKQHTACGPGTPSWVKLHRMVQAGGYALGAFGFFLGLLMWGDAHEGHVRLRGVGGEEAGEFDPGAHRRYGITLFILASFQVGVPFRLPSSPYPPSLW
ncbi:unnamed protein product [Closterium sp. NIES-65]|nr:unnamed protein product [Closterium sp. NIES-65]